MISELDVGNLLFKGFLVRNLNRLSDISAEHINLGFNRRDVVDDNTVQRLVRRRFITVLVFLNGDVVFLIKQLFILTHNAFFHREVTYPHANRYEFVSFYLVKKTANRSSVKLFEEVNPECPTEKINVNPVKNSYAALWEEYKEVSSGIPLMNTIRRILEYYFLQLCGYEGSHLRQRILEEHKRDFTADAQGREDYTKYDLASAMLSYIAANETGFNDGMHYVDDYMDTQLCRDTFKMVFTIMGQEQHYNMMMGIQ